MPLSLESMSTWILDRLFDDRAAPKFSFRSTVNWMRSLALLVDDAKFSDPLLKSHYLKVNRRKTNHDADTLVFENMLMAFHNFSSLSAFNNAVNDKYDVVRAAIISWYYCTYFTSSAMIAAASGASSETHTGTARIWHSDFVQSNLLVTPFSLYLDSLVSEDVDTAIAVYRGSNCSDVNTRPTTKDEAWGAVVSYLRGTAKHEREKVENRVRESSEFRGLGVDNFRTKAARKLRDKALAKSNVNFLIQSFRYRGKANYRDSVFLSYGADETEHVEEFIGDLFYVAEKYIRMAVHYIARRVECGTWEYFVDDLEINSRLSIGVEVMRL